MVSMVGEKHQDFKAGEFRFAHPKGYSIENELERPVKGQEDQKGKAWAGVEAAGMETSGLV